MVSTRYAGDYRLDLKKDSKGKLRRVLVYTGPHYEFARALSDVKVHRNRCLVLMIIVWSFFIAEIVAETSWMHYWYIALPLICSVMPKAFVTTGIYYLYKTKLPYDRMHKERTMDRIKGQSLLDIVLTAWTLGACIVLSVTGQCRWESMQDIAFLVLSAGVILLMAAMIKLATAFDMKEIPNPNALKWKKMDSLEEAALDTDEENHL